MKEPDWPQGLVKQFLAQPVFLYSGVRRINQDLTWTINELPDITYEQLGYGKNKEKLLYRNYINEEEFERVRKLLDKRAGSAFTSVAMSLRGAKKDSRSMGHCMQTLIVSWKKDFETVEVQYRSTEVIQKFGADLVFMQYLFDELDLTPDIIRFRFANAFLSGVFFPVLCTFWDAIDFFDFLWEHDQMLFAGGTRFFLRSTYKQDQHFPYSPQDRLHQFAWKHLDMKRIREYLEEKHQKFGKPLPRIHYNKDEYVLRRNRK